jgi:hypothetical protein
MDAEQALRVRPDRPRLEARAARQRAQAVDGELVRVLGVDALAFVQLEALGRERDRLLLPAHQVDLDALQRGVVEGVVPFSPRSSPRNRSACGNGKRNASPSWKASSRPISERTPDDRSGLTAGVALASIKLWLPFVHEAGSHRNLRSPFISRT